MRIKLRSGVIVESRTFVRLEWKGIIPILVVHEKFEKVVKWVLRTLAFIGIASSLISIDSKLVSLLVSLLIFGVEQFFERVIFEYTTMIIPSMPDFEVDYSQWKTNAFLIPRFKNGTDLAHFAPVYVDRDYALRFFKFLASWNTQENNNVIVSVILEPDNRYSTFIYADPNRPGLDKLFEEAAEKNKVSKYGKRQQQFIMGTIFWHTFDFKEGMFIDQFLKFQNPAERFNLIPAVLPKDGEETEYLMQASILINKLKLKKRGELTQQDMEYRFSPKKS